MADRLSRQSVKGGKMAYDLNRGQAATFGISPVMRGISLHVAAPWRILIDALKAWGDMNETQRTSNK